MKKAFSIVFLLFLWLQLAAQGISVASFSLLENDLTANTSGTMVLDQNGEKCALIKVETTQTGFTFDVGSLGVVKTEQRTAEIWVYVPAGVNRITVAHQQLGRLNDYDPGMTLQKAKTYRMKLTTGTVTTVVEEAVTNQFLLFQVSPENATVIVNDEVWTVNDGIARKYIPFGTYSYRVMAQDYFPTAGNITVNDPNNKQIVNVSLKPNFVQVTVNAANQAEIWINGENKGNGKWTGNLGGGEYLMEARLEGHRSNSVHRTIKPEEGPQTIILPSPTPIYGKLLVSTMPDFADIYIDNIKVGETPQLMRQVLIGHHKVVIRKYGYKDLIQDIVISEGVTANMEGVMEKGASSLESVDRQTKDDYASENITVNEVSFKMIRVQGGTFQMGSSLKGSSDDERPVHSVTLSDFYLGETEVTQELWEAVMGKNPSNFKGASRPVDNVSWNDCQIFIKKLNQLTGRYFRLPTEAEWEYAAGGGILSHNNYYSGSNNANEVAWYSDNGRGGSHEVKSLKPNELGLYDMSGNVCEWCYDWKGDYRPSQQKDPKGSTKGIFRVRRGGCWYYRAKSCRTTSRDYYSPSSRSSYGGLRLAL